MVSMVKSDPGGEEEAATKNKSLKEVSKNPFMFLKFLFWLMIIIFMQGENNEVNQHLERKEFVDVLKPATMDVDISDVSENPMIFPL